MFGREYTTPKENRCRHAGNRERNPNDFPAEKFMQRRVDESSGKPERDPNAYSSEYHTRPPNRKPLDVAQNVCNQGSITSRQAKQTGVGIPYGRYSAERRRVHLEWRSATLISPILQAAKSL